MLFFLTRCRHAINNSLYHYLWWGIWQNSMKNAPTICTSHQGTVWLWLPFASTPKLWISLLHSPSLLQLMHVLFALLPLEQMFICSFCIARPYGIIIPINFHKNCHFKPSLVLWFYTKPILAFHPSNDLPLSISGVCLYWLISVRPE